MQKIKKQRMPLLIAAIVLIVMMAVLISTTAPAFAAGSVSIVDVRAYGNYETAGINIEVEGLTAQTEGFIFYKEAGSPQDYQEGHFFTKYDNRHMATSLFDLKSDTAYDIIIKLYDGGSGYLLDTQGASVATKPEYAGIAKIEGVTPIINIANNSELADKLALIVDGAGAEVRLAPGIYSGAALASGLNKSGNEASNIIITSENGLLTDEKPIIQGTVAISNRRYITFHNIESTIVPGTPVTNLLSFTNCQYITVSSCYVHDADRSGESACIYFVGPTGTNYGLDHTGVRDGHHLVINCTLGDNAWTPTNTSSNTNDTNRTYFGINCRNNPGGYLTVRNNIFYGLIDGIHSGESEKYANSFYPAPQPGMDNATDFNLPIHSVETDDFLDHWYSQELDFYDNIIYECKDDCIETDGHSVNGRFFRNRLGTCETAISIAAVYPGPNFFVRNYMAGYVGNSLKHNTGTVNYYECTVNCYFYNNTIVQTANNNNCFYMCGPGYIGYNRYVNNIFYAINRIYNADDEDQDRQPKDYRTQWIMDTMIFDYNILYSENVPHDNEAVDTNPVYMKTHSLVNPGVIPSFWRNLESYRLASGQELHSVPADPLLVRDAIPGTYDTIYASMTGLFTLELMEGSPAIDAGVYIPGITNRISGAAPDIGAFEFPQPSISINGDTAVATGAGATANYTISAKDMPMTNAIDIEFEVDGDFLSANSAVAVNGFYFLSAGNYGSPFFWKQVGNIWVAKAILMNNEGVEGDFDIINLVFNVPEGTLGATDVKINAIEVSSGGNPVAAAILKGVATTIFETWYSPFDLNKDGVIDLNDLTFALQFLAIKAGDPEWEHAKICDFSENDEIDIADLILILANYTVPYYG